MAQTHVDFDDADFEGASGFPVKLPSGAEFLVLTQEEVDYLTERITRYLTENQFKNVSDHQDLDKMVIFELFIHRWSQQVSQGEDYYGDPIDTKQLTAQINNLSAELRLLKKALGVDKVSRDRQRGDDSVVIYLENLRERARAFGYHRNKQTAKIMELFAQLQTLIGFHDRCDKEERQEFHATEEDILKWIREICIPEYEKLDEEYRKEQKTWIRSM